MKYIVNNKEVSRDTFYFCKRAKEENKTFILSNICTYSDSYINEQPEYDYYICDEIKTYYTKGEAVTTEWLSKDGGWSKNNLEDITKRYNKSKFKDTMTFKEWYTKNGWEYKSETKYTKECHNIPTAEDFGEEKEVRTKLFSVKVTNNMAVQTLNTIKEEYGDCIEYVLRDNTYTEIIYRDSYMEI